MSRGKPLILILLIGTVLQAGNNNQTLESVIEMLEKSLLNEDMPAKDELSKKSSKTLMETGESEVMANSDLENEMEALRKEMKDFELKLGDVSQRVFDTKKQIEDKTKIKNEVNIILALPNQIRLKHVELKIGDVSIQDEFYTSFDMQSEYPLFRGTLLPGKHQLNAKIDVFETIAESEKLKSYTKDFSFEIPSGEQHRQIVLKVGENLESLTLEQVVEPIALSAEREIEPAEKLEIEKK